MCGIDNPSNQNAGYQGLRMGEEVAEVDMIGVTGIQLYWQCAISYVE